MSCGGCAACARAQRARAVGARRHAGKYRTGVAPARPPERCRCPLAILVAAIYNLFNKNFLDFQPYAVPGQRPPVSYGNLYANSQEGRRLWVSANYEF